MDHCFCLLNADKPGAFDKKTSHVNIGRGDFLNYTIQWLFKF